MSLIEFNFSPIAPASMIQATVDEMVNMITYIIRAAVALRERTDIAKRVSVN